MFLIMMIDPQDKDIQVSEQLDISKLFGSRTQYAERTLNQIEKIFNKSCKHTVLNTNSFIAYLFRKEPLYSELFMT